MFETKHFKIFGTPYGFLFMLKIKLLAIVSSILDILVDLLDLKLGQVISDSTLCKLNLISVAET